MNKTEKLLALFHQAASQPRARMEAYLAAGKKVVLTAPVYTPEEIIHAMGLVPMGVWGADLPLERSKEYFPAFICSIMQSILELDIRGTTGGPRPSSSPPCATPSSAWGRTGSTP